jgi:hypothetical protein
VKKTCSCLFLFALAVAGVISITAVGDGAPATPRGTPEDIASRALAALKENRIADFTKEMHPEALQSLKKRLLEVVDAAEEKGRAAETLKIFKGVSEPGQLRAMDDTEFFTAFFEGMLALQPRVRDAFKDMALDVVGHVREGDDVVHVVYRGTTSVGNVKISKMSVMSLKADGESWRMLLSGDIEGMAAMMKLQFGARE